MKKHGHVFVTHAPTEKSMRLFCRNCNAQQTILLPLVVEDFAATCLTFDRAHNDCPEPHPGQQTHPVGTAPK